MTERAGRALRLAVIGATGALGRALVQELEESALPVASLALYASARGAGSELEFRGEPLRVEELRAGGPASTLGTAVPASGGSLNGAAPNGTAAPAAGAAQAHGASFSGLDLAFFAATPTVTGQWLAAVRAGGCGAVDLGPFSRADLEVPLLLPELDPEAIAGFARTGRVAVPAAPAAQLVLALHPLHRAVGIERAEVTTLLPASSVGQAGIDALEGELRAMLSFAEPPPPSAFPHRLAFNVVPHAGAFDEAGHAEGERSLPGEVRRLLGSSLSIAVTELTVPVFHGCVQVVALCTRQPLAAAEARALLRGAPGVKLLDAPGEGVYPMPMLAVNDEAVLVGRVRDDPTRKNGLLLVLAGDNLRRGAASAVGVASLLRERGLVGQG